MINNGNVTVNSGGLTVTNLFNQADSSFVVGSGALANIQDPVSNSGEIELGGSNARCTTGRELVSPTPD
jgi:hypothetical protein